MFEDLKNYTEEMVSFRRSFHKYPETGWTEFRTTAIIAERLNELGYEVLLGKAIINPDFVMGRSKTEVEAAQCKAVELGISKEAIGACQGYTGCAAILETGRPGPVTALRFDIDALYVTETENVDHIPNKEGFRSEFQGKMHACGHDCHAATGLAMAHWLKVHEAELNGTVKLLFQPAEEGTRGALAMTESGILDDVNYLVGAHIACTPRLGQVFISEPGYNATIKFDVHLEGRAAHSVANPQDGRNALMAAAHALVLCGSMPKHGDGLTSISCGKLTAGEMRNVIPVKAKMEMEVRGASNELCQYAFSEAERSVKFACAAFDVTYRIEKVGQAYTMNPSPELADLLEVCACETVGEKGVGRYSEKGGSEDFTVMMDRVQKLGGKAAHFYYGADSTCNYRSDFDPDDVRSMPIGFEVLVRVLTRLNGEKDC